MYKLLIVDDEYQVRTGLRDLIDWNALGITVAADADDGDTALPLLHAIRPDILLTDVRMNRMEGLQLAREARRLLPDIAIVFISGYSDAQYLRDALRVKAVDYLYKPVRIATLQALMREVVAKLDAHAQEIQRREQARRLLEKSRPLLIERFVRDWLGGVLEDEQIIRERLAQLDLPFASPSGIGVAVFQPEWEVFPDGRQSETCQILLERSVRRLLPGALTCAEGTGVVALFPASDAAALHALADRLNAVCIEAREQLGVRLPIGVSLWHDAWSDAPLALDEARQVVERCIDALEGVSLFSPQDTLNISETSPAVAMPDLDFLSRTLLIGDFEALWNGLQSRIGELLCGDHGTERAREMLMLCALHADLLLSHQGLAGVDACVLCRRALGHISVYGLLNAFGSALRDACERVRQERSRTYSAAVERTLDAIRTRYAEPLRVEDLAAIAHYSPSHLSTLFRQETGTTIGDALLRARLDAAMELLRSTTEPVSSVAQRVGYADMQYFSRVFKRSTGLTPLEYRRKALPC